MSAINLGKNQGGETTGQEPKIREEYLAGQEPNPGVLSCAEIYS